MATVGGRSLPLDLPASGAALAGLPAGRHLPCLASVRLAGDGAVPAGSLTIVEYFDCRCPLCKRDHAILTDLVARDGDIRLVMKDWPIFGAPSVLASQLVFGAASMGSYAQAHSALMATGARLSEDQIRQVLADAGIDTGAALAAYQADSDRRGGLLARNAAQAAALGLQGMPAFIIGPAIYPGALGEAGLRQAITHARQAA